MTPVPVIAHTCRPSVTGEGVDMFCFCPRRFSLDSSRFHRMLPGVTIDGPELDVPRRPRRRDVQEHKVVPDDGRGPAVGGQRKFPGDVLRRAPRRRESGLYGRAVEQRPAPLRPVRRQRASRRKTCHEAPDDEQARTMLKLYVILRILPIRATGSSV